MPIVLLSILVNSVIGSHSLAHLVRRVFLTISQLLINNASFVESAIAELVHTHAVVEMPFIPHVINPLSVSIQSSGKKRLMFRCEDWRVLLSYVNKGDYFSVSISSLDITISIFFRITKVFWVPPGFFLVPFGIFVLHHFRSV